MLFSVNIIFIDNSDRAVHPGPPEDLYILVSIPVKTASWGTMFPTFFSQYRKHFQGCQRSYVSSRLQQTKVICVVYMCFGFQEDLKIIYHWMDGKFQAIHLYKVGYCNNIPLKYVLAGHVHFCLRSKPHHLSIQEEFFLMI